MNILEISNLEKNYGNIKAVGGISFNVKKGEIVGFIGPNGSGKTTTLRMVTNLIWPDNGTIIIGGYDLMKQRNKALSCIAGIVENPGLYQNLTGLDNLKFIQGIRNISEKRLKECIEITGLGDHLKRTVHKYSLGMKQRLALGMSLLTKPELLILDEPTNGLDPTGTLELREMLDSMVSSENTSILFSSHQLGEVEKLAKHVVFIKTGCIVMERENFRTNEVDYILSVSDSAKALDVLHTIPEIIKAEANADGQILVRVANLTFNTVLSSIYNSNIKVSDVEKRSYDLEVIYNELYRSFEGGENNV